MSKAVILVVEDEDLQYEIYEETLAGYELLRARSGQEALQLLTHVPVKVIILDHVLAEGDLGLDYLPDIKDLLPHVPVIIISGVLEVRDHLQALQGPRSADFCIAKPVDVDDLVKTVETAINECGESEAIRRFESLERSLREDVEVMMTRSTDRLTRQKILRDKIKGSNSRPNISALARDFNVARRTVIRDIHELIRRGQLPEDSLSKWPSGRDED